MLNEDGRFLVPVRSSVIKRDFYFFIFPQDLRAERGNDGRYDIYKVRNNIFKREAGVRWAAQLFADVTVG